MSKDIDKTAAELIADIEKKDRRFRTSLTVFVAAILIAIAGVAFVQFKTLDTQKKTIQEIRTTTGEINRHIDCIIVYFSQANRAGLTIEDINSCTLSRDGTPQQFFSNSDSSAEPSTPAENPKVSSQAPSSQTPSQSPNEPTPTEPEEENSTPLLPEICVPITNICINGVE